MIIITATPAETAEFFQRLTSRTEDDNFGFDFEDDCPTCEECGECIAAGGYDCECEESDDSVDGDGNDVCDCCGDDVYDGVNIDGLCDDCAENCAEIEVPPDDSDDDKEATKPDQKDEEKLQEVRGLGWTYLYGCDCENCMLHRKVKGEKVVSCKSSV
jgi:hypothetical protein